MSATAPGRPRSFAAAVVTATLAVAVAGAICFAETSRAESPSAPDDSGAFLTLTVQADFVAAEGKIKEATSVLALRRAVAFGLPGGDFLENLTITPDCPPLPNDRLIEGLVMELSLSSPHAKIFFHPERITVTGATDSRVSHAAVHARLYELAAGGLKFDNRLQVVPSAELPLPPPRPDFQPTITSATEALPPPEIAAAQALSPAPKTSDADPASTMPRPDASELAAELGLNVDTAGDPAEAESPEEDPKPKPPPPPKRDFPVYFGPDSFVVLGEQLNAAKRIAQRVQNHPSEDPVILRAYARNDDRAAYHAWVGTQRLDAVKTLLVTHGVSEDKLRQQTQEPPDGDQDRIDTRIDVILPKLPPPPLPQALPIAVPVEFETVELGEAEDGG